ncbi:unnamed protein product [Urochloa decumbens]|uniref:F-box domain-containing protein n=1 Tax=Urochloa decumbens TaxID=240449 RepID=A0ABC9ETW1_9POAL
MDQGTTAAPYLPDELVVEILARLPAKLLCRFKCISRRWRRLISDPDHRARLAQTLSGFFFVSSDPGWHFIGLPSERKIEMLDSCNGLLLLRCSDEHSSRPSPPFYIVCNPATREWVALPQPKYTNGGEQGMRVWYAAVGFDPAISSHFYVFQVVEESEGMWCSVIAVEVYSSETGTWDIRELKHDYCLSFLGRMTYFNGFLHLPIGYTAVASVHTKGQSWRLTQIEEEERMYNYFVDAVEIYSSDTGTWARKFTQWDWDMDMTGHKTYFNGFLHLTMCNPNAVAMVDTEGQAWRTIAVPSNGFCRSSGFVGHSQGHLVYVDVRMKRVPALAIYALEDHSRDRWTLRHKVIMRRRICLD